MKEKERERVKRKKKKTDKDRLRPSGAFVPLAKGPPGAGGNR